MNFRFIFSCSNDSGSRFCILISSFPTFPGCLVEAEAIGVLMMEDEAGIDHKIIAKPIEKIDPRHKHILDINDLTDHFKIEIKEFFENYKNLEPDKWVKLKGFEDKKSAEKIIQQAFKRK